MRSGDIHLWYVFPDEIRDESLYGQYRMLLSAEEAGRQQRFYFARHRRQFLIAHALVRTMLSRFTGEAPDRLQFLKNRYGRPELAGGDDLPPVRFNLSHTEGIIACAVSLRDDVGVDVEDMERKAVTPGLAERFFSSREVEDLNRLRAPDRRDRFYDYWTLKESYIKARGMGLAIPLGQFSFHLPNGRSVGISFDPRLKDDPTRWRFWLMRPTRRHKAALSICRKGHGAYRLLTRKIVPLAHEDDFPCTVVRQSPP